MEGLLGELDFVRGGRLGGEGGGVGELEMERGGRGGVEERAVEMAEAEEMERLRWVERRGGRAGEGGGERREDFFSISSSC